MKIKKIKKIGYNEDVYNLHIEDNHNYFANNHCVSNCHDFDDVMSNFISIKITETIVKKFNFANERDIIKKLKVVSSIASYVDFLGYLNNEIVSTMEQMEKGMSVEKRDVVQDKRDLKLIKILKNYLSNYELRYKKESKRNKKIKTN